jgi:kinesin family protein C1
LSGGKEKAVDTPDERRMNAIESKITSMQDLFDLEKRRTEDLLTRERAERQSQEDKVRQLEQDLLEQRRVAGQNYGNDTAPWAMEEEMRKLKQRFDLEKDHLQGQLEREQMTVSALKVRQWHIRGKRGCSLVEADVYSS